MSTRYLALASIGLLALSGSAFADQFQFDSPGSNIWQGVYVNPYYAHQTPGGAKNSLQIYCDDWNTDFSGTPSWTGTIYSLTASNVQNFKFGKITQAYDVTESSNILTYNLVSVTSDDVYRRYLEAAWLDEQIAASSSDLAKQELSAAMWTLFVNPSHVTSLINDRINVSGGAFVHAVAVDLSTAFLKVTDTHNPYTGSGWDVIVPADGRSMQEFLVDAPVPEPGAVVLLGTVVGWLGLTGFRRRQRMPAAKSQS